LGKCEKGEKGVKRESLSWLGEELDRDARRIRCVRCYGSYMPLFGVSIDEDDLDMLRYQPRRLGEKDAVERNMRGLEQALAIANRERRVGPIPRLRLANFGGGEHG
jgi:hypothetical protein